MGHFQDLVKGKWELNQLFLTRENSFKFLVDDNYKLQIMREAEAGDHSGDHIGC